MEVPEKIYLDIRGFENVDIPFSLARKRFGVSYYEYPVSNNDVEYTRTDAFIEKACEGIENLLSGYIIKNFHFGDSYDMDKLIEDFRRYMKGE